jgi:DNA-binding NarL/FixJ family response regulator
MRSCSVRLRTPISLDGRYPTSNFPMTRVLIADDSVPLRSGLPKLIEEHTGWVCAEALNGRDAIAKIQQLIPDVLILDLCMPVMDGLRAARAITKLIPNLPILLCTSNLPPALISMAQGCGIQGTVSKYNGHQIISGIEALLRHETFFCRS